MYSYRDGYGVANRWWWGGNAESTLADENEMPYIITYNKRKIQRKVVRKSDASVITICKEYENWISR